MNIIITAFNNITENDIEYHAGKNILKRLPSEINGVQIKKVVLPLAFNSCFDVLKPQIDNDTIAIISFGAAGGSCFAIERICVNIMDSKGKDNEGYKASDEIIKRDGPNAYFTTLNFRRIEKALNEQNIPAIISNSAGLALCNNIFYNVAYHAHKYNLNYVYGFIHVPHMKHSVNKNKYTMEISRLVQGALIVISDCINNI